MTIKDTFDEISPITGELAVLIEDNLKIDMSTGYNTIHDLWFEGSEEIEKVENSIPSYMIKYKVVDNVNNVWYPILLVNSEKILYPYPDPELPDSNFYWAVTKVKPIESKEEIGTEFTFVLPTKIGGKTESVIYKLESTPLKLFTKNSFPAALDFYHEQEQSV